MFIYFSGRKLCKSSVLLAPNIMIGPTIHAIASGVILNPNILRENIPLKNLNFQTLEDVSRYRDPQLQVGENYSYLFNFR